MGLSMRPLRKMRSVSLAPTLPFRSSMFSRTCWKAAVTRETNYSDRDATVCNRAGAFVVVVKNLDSRRQPRLFTQDVNPQTWTQIRVVCCTCVPHPLGKYVKARKSLHVWTVLGWPKSKHTFRCTGFDSCSYYEITLSRGQITIRTLLCSFRYKSTNGFEQSLLTSW